MSWRRAMAAHLRRLLDNATGSGDQGGFRSPGSTEKSIALLDARRPGWISLVETPSGEQRDGALFADERLVARFRPLPTVRRRIDEMLWGATRYQSQREEPDSKRTSDDCIRNHDQQTGSLGNATHPAVRWRLDSGVAIAVRRLMRRVPGAPCWRRLWHSSTCG